MRRTMIVPAALGLALLAGCDNSVEPSPPPSSEDALTTATAAPATPSDEVEVTTEAAPTTQAPAETEIETDTAEPEPEGAPEMPEEATEQTEEGAEAFALHYLDLINYTGMHPEAGLLDPLGSDSCESCTNYEENVAQLIAEKAANNEAAAVIHGASVVQSGSSYLVLVDLEQAAYEVVAEDGSTLRSYERTPGVQFKFTLTADDPWLVEEIQVSAS